MKFKFVLQIVAVLAIVGILAGCSGPTPTVAPTPDMAATMNAMKVELQQTLVADMTKNAPTATNTVPPTETPVPATPTTAATNTPPPPAATATNTAAPVVVATLTQTPTPAELGCIITDVSPANGADFKPQTDFDAKFTVKNTGLKTLSADDVDIVYSSGSTTKLHTGGDALDLNSSIESGKTYAVSIDMMTPDSTGNYTSTWTVRGAGQNLCSITFSVDVVQ